MQNALEASLLIGTDIHWGNKYTKHYNPTKAVCTVRSHINLACN